MQNDERWFVLGINPEPWAVGPLGVGRKNGKPFPYMGKNEKLEAYQEALREDLEGAGILEGKVELKIFIWRDLADAKTFDGRKRKAHTSDATNIQKATEDALQGVLIGNDRDVVSISTTVVEQGKGVNPRIAICVKPAEVFNPAAIPDSVWRNLDRANGMELTQPSLWDSGKEGEDYF